MYQILKNTDLFKDVDEQAVQAIAKFSKQMKLGSGDSLFDEKQSSDDHDLFLLISGELDVVTSPSRKSRRELLLAQVDSEVFGELAWSLKCKRTAVIKCRDDAEVIRINGEKLDALLADNATVGFQVTKKIMELLAHKVANTNSMLKVVLQNSFVI